MVAKFRLGTGISEGEVVKVNDKTIWVKLKNGDVVQRHIEKHVIEMKEK